MYDIYRLFNHSGSKGSGFAWILIGCASLAIVLRDVTRFTVLLHHLVQ